MNQLEDLLQQCTVKLIVPGQMGWGTGFFVAPGLILTCEHVVKKANGRPVQVWWQNQNWAEAIVEKSLPDPDDLALLRVMLTTEAHPCVYLNELVQSRDPLYLFGYPDDFPNGCPATPICEGYTGDIPPLIKFSQGQIRPGMSGSPLLSQRTGKVCGIVKFTRDRSIDLGGGAIPAKVILAQFPELRELQRQWHQGERRWLDRAVQPPEVPTMQQVNFGGENFQIQTGPQNTNHFGDTHNHYNYYLANSDGSFPKNQQAFITSYSDSENIRKLKEQINQPLNLPLIPNTQPFEFTVIAVDTQGKEVIRCQKQSQLFIEKLGNLEIEMVVIPSGEFQMGSFEKKPPANESPLHWVTIQPFLMSKYPITKAQWKSVADLPQSCGRLRKQPSRSGSADHPVVQVSWYNAVEFCNCLSAATGRKYRLPTEAEWEYACRAGTTTPFHFGATITTNLANYDGRYPYYRSEPKGENRDKSTKVGSFPAANLFGLFDMHGNVWEWCQDSWYENYETTSATGKAWLDREENYNRVIRGGSWVSEALKCRSAYRTFGNAHHPSKNTGFRIVRSLSM